MYSKRAIGASVLFEDAGTNSQIDRNDPNKDNPDTDDAANFAAVLRAFGLTDFVVHGCELAVDYDTDDINVGQQPAVSVSTGAAILNDDSAYAVKAGRQQNEVAYLAKVPTVTDVPLVANTINEVHLHLPLTDNDAAEVVTTDVGEGVNELPPSRPRLHIGTVDTRSDEYDVRVHNRDPALFARSLTGSITNGSEISSLIGGDLAVNGDGEVITLSSTGGISPEAVAKLAEDQTVTGAWAFRKPITGSITGSAPQLGGEPADSFVQYDQDRTITGGWAFDRAIDASITGSAAQFDGEGPGSYARRDVEQTIDAAWRFVERPSLGSNGLVSTGDAGTTFSAPGHDHDSDDLQPDTVDAQEITTDSLRITRGRGLLDLPLHHVSYQTGLSNEEIARFSLDSNEVLEVWRLEVTLKGGGTNDNFGFDVYDVSDGRVLASTTTRAIGDAEPLATSVRGATIAVRLTNRIGRAQAATLLGEVAIVGFES